MTIQPWAVEVRIQASRIEEVKALTNKHFNCNVISLKELRRYVGKVQSFASLVFTWRPFVHMLCTIRPTPHPATFGRSKSKFRLRRFSNFQLPMTRWFVA